MTRGEHLERELVLLRLKVDPAHTDAVRGHVVRSGGRVLDPAADGFVVELTASESEVNSFVAELGRAHVRTPVTDVSRMPSSACKKNNEADCRHRAGGTPDAHLVYI